MGKDPGSNSTAHVTRHMAPRAQTIVWLPSAGTKTNPTGPCEFGERRQLLPYHRQAGRRSGTTKPPPAWKPPSREDADQCRCWLTPSRRLREPTAHLPEAESGWDLTEETRSWYKSMLFPHVSNPAVPKGKGKQSLQPVKLQIATLAIKIVLVTDNAGKGESFSLRISQLGTRSCWI